MSTNPTRGQECTATEPTITSQHTGYDRYGRPNHTYYRCEACGWDTYDPTIEQRGCPNCGAGRKEVR